jgi:hypothetical protein
MGSVGDAGFDGDAAPAFLLFGVRDFDGGVAIFVVDYGLLGDGEYILVLFKEDLGVGGHIGLEFAARVVDGNADLKGSDIVLLDAEGSDAGDLAEEGLLFEGLDLNASGLAEVDLANIRLIDPPLHIDLVDIADGHDEGRGAAEDEDGGDCVAFFHVAGEYDSVHGRSDGGVGELLLKLVEGGAGLGDLCLGLLEAGGVDGDLGEGFVAGVGGEEVLLMGVVKCLLRDYAVLGHLLGAVVGVLVHGEVGGFSTDLVILDGGGGGAGVGLGRIELGSLGVYLSENLYLIELGEDLALFHDGVDVGVEPGDYARGLGFDLDLGDGLDLAGGDDGAGDVAPFSLAELGGFKLRATTASSSCHAKHCCYYQEREAGPDPEPAFGVALRGHSVAPKKWEKYYLGGVLRRASEGSSITEMRILINLTSSVFTQDPKDLALDSNVGCGSVDGGHLGVGGLKADPVALAVEALEGGVGAVDESDDDLAFASGACALDEDVIPGDDVLVTHGVAADLQGKDFPVADDVIQGDALRGFDGFNWLAGSDATEQREAVGAFLAGTHRQHVDGAAAIVSALEEALVLQIGDVFVNGGKGAEAESTGDFFIGGRVSVLLGEAGEEVDDLFLPPRYSHAGIVANKKRIR